MQTTEKHKYLGDTISSSGNNDAKTKERCKTGHSAIAQIKSVLNEARFGKFKVQTCLIMRDSIFVSKVLLNSEVWHSVTKSQVEDHELYSRENFLA